MHAKENKENNRIFAFIKSFIESTKIAIFMLIGNFLINNVQKKEKFDVKKQVK